jgi:hypothetical protein
MDIFPGFEGFPELSRTDCSSCEALWRDYRDAMIAHLAAVDELELAQFMENARKSQCLQADVMRAERKRDHAHAAAVSHERTHRVRMAA